MDTTWKSLASRLHPGYFSLVALAAGGGAFLLSLNHNGCGPYATKSLANALIVLALVAQAGALLYSIGQCLARVPGSGRGFLASLFLSVLAVPGAVVLAVFVNGVLCD
jgi:hypothetical protein